MSEWQTMTIVVTNLLAAALVPLVLLVAALREPGPRSR